MNIEHIKEAVRKECKGDFCKGTWHEIDLNEGKPKMVDCRCLTKLKKYVSYESSGITQEWWNFNISDIEEDFEKKILKDIKWFINNTKQCLVNKTQFLFFGSNGVGKTTMSILMAKGVIDLGYKALIINSKDLIDYLYNGNIHIFDDIDFLVIDELDKIRKNVVEDFCSEMISLMDKKTLVLISNLDMSQLKIKFPDYFYDRLNTLYKIKFPTRNYRRQFKSKFEMLKEEDGR